MQKQNKNNRVSLKVMRQYGSEDMQKQNKNNGVDRKVMRDCDTQPEVFFFWLVPRFHKNMLEKKSINLDDGDAILMSIHLSPIQT